VSGQIHDAANRLLEDSNFTYAYDANGNLETKTDKGNGDSTVYTYDAENQLIQVQAFTLAGGSTPILVAEYRYDALGRRIEKNVNGVITRYIYDNEDIAVELDGANLVRANYAHGPGIDEPLTVFRGAEGGLFVYHADGLGSITDLTDATGTVARSYTYDSFGQIVDQTGSVTNPYTYTAREFDPETGLYYYRARHYDPTIGRFLQEDPIQFLGGVNFYVYVGNNSVLYVDPGGQGVLGIGVLVGAGVGALSGIAGALAQEGTWADVAIAGAVGLAAGALVGAVDPTEGVLTTMAVMGAIGGGSNAFGQIITNVRNKGNPFADFSVGSFIGSTLGSTIGGLQARVVTTGLATLGASQSVSALGGLSGLAPSALGGPIGREIEKTLTRELPEPLFGDLCPAR